MKEMDAKLESMVAQMNASKGDKKIQAMAAVINEMVEQRREMHERMTGMMQNMMGHAMQHMQSSWASCPMMDGMKRELHTPQHKTK
jgi:hypothetical protein